MNKGKGNTDAPLGVLAEIAGRLANIAPEHFIVPPMDREEGDHVVVTATDDIKRLFTLRNYLIDRCSDLSVNILQVTTDAEHDLLERGRRVIAEEFETPGSPTFEMRAKIEKSTAELGRTDELLEIIDNILWFEVRRQHPDLESKQVVGIRSDWSLIWKEPEKNAGAQVSFHLAGSSDMSGLAEILSRRHTPTQ